jgi:hypothetical protein
MQCNVPKVAATACSCLSDQTYFKQQMSHDPMHLILKWVYGCLHVLAWWPQACRNCSLTVLLTVLIPVLLT